MEELKLEGLNIIKEKSNVYYALKRIIDIMGAFLGLIILSPIMLITAIMIKFTSKGPIIFAQERVGKNGEMFKMYKFRSMVLDAEERLNSLKDKNEMKGPMFKIKDDPRITNIGKFIRRTSIDELPQFINVIKGDMSLVGPRPNLKREVIYFSEYERQKLLAKPGLTCYWQVMGRNTLSFEEWIRLDIKYINERSILIDIKLILKTFLLLFGDRNAS